MYGKEKEISFKRLPNVNDVTINIGSKEKDENIYLDYKDNLLILNFPYYLNKINYGFKIVYPFEEVEK